jgi:PIN domain nuclease of toxin-antitoxin system
MRLLLDTHAFLWALAEPEKLSKKAAEALIAPENKLFMSIVTAWETSILQSLGRIDMSLPIEQADQALRGTWLSIELRHTAILRSLPRHHRDPFDRMLVAQATLEGMVLVTGDSDMRRYDVATLW